MVKSITKRKIMIFCIAIAAVLITITASLAYAATKQTYYVPDEGEYKGQMVYIQTGEHDPDVLCIITPLPEQLK